MKTVWMGMALAMAMGCAQRPNSGAVLPPSVNDKVEDIAEGCGLNGFYRVDAGWPTRAHQWFAFQGGELVFSRSDVDPHLHLNTAVLKGSEHGRPAEFVSLLQIEDGSDAFLQYDLHLEKLGCTGRDTELGIMKSLYIESSLTGEDLDPHVEMQRGASITRLEVDWHNTPDSKPELDYALHQRLRSFGVSHEINISRIYLQDVKNHERRGGRVKIQRALEAALNSWFNDGRDLESPMGLLWKTEREFDGNWPEDSACPGAMTVHKRLACLMSQPGSLIRMLTTRLPENGESTEDNWVFELSLDNYSDHTHFAIVPNDDTTTTYNYGFN